MPFSRERRGKGGGKGLLRSRARRRGCSPGRRPVSFVHQPWKRYSKYRDGNKVIRPINPCILTRYGKTTEANCANSARWMGIPRGDQGERHCAGAEAGV